ncbi:SRPBCC domain-containing protein [Streptomyces sp. NPDC049687]|uniref:SRPBCC domain-containing protein n=1 Tax=Streptomyces sp. NPDC049687 TaxID=3365596 RepID=UPI003788DF5C
MEHEVFVPVPAERLRAALADPVQVARAVPGFQQDAGTAPVAGRLKVRIGGHTITYRGAVRITAREDGAYAVEGDATEARGSGSVRLALSLRPRETGAGTTLRFKGTASADGRVAELPEEQVGAAVARLLNRFAENLGAGVAEEAVSQEQSEPTEEPEVTVFEAEVPPSGVEESPDEPMEPMEPVESGGADEADEADEAGEPGEPPAEAAHARRTMIGRSAEEVDHAPPRGRYAPVPAPQTVVQNSALRWAAPAAALVVASAIVVGRALRRRR